MAVGLIYMILKGNSQSVEVGNRGPITLLNTIYKINAKAMSLRIQRMSPTLVHHSQTGFVKERIILDNILDNSPRHCHFAPGF